MLHTRFFGSWECFMPTDACCFPYLGSLSFFNSHPSNPSNRVSFSFFRLKSFRSSPFFFRARPFARQWSFPGGRSCLIVFVSNSSTLRFDPMRRWPVFFELAAGFDLAPFQKNVTYKSYVLPQDHGALVKVVKV